MPKRKRGIQKTNQQQQQKKHKKKGKRNKQRRCWIQECPHVLPNTAHDEASNNSLTLRISVAALNDGYQNLTAEKTKSDEVQPKEPSSLAHILPQPPEPKVLYTERLPHAPLPATPPPLDPNATEEKDDVPSNVHPKYWSQRYRYFSKFDDGIRMTPAAWYSVTPSVLAQHMARRLLPNSTSTNNTTVILDACCGVGGNTIALAQTFPHATILAVDTDRTSLEHLAHNAVTVYGIPAERLLLLQMDVLQVLQCYENGRKKGEGAPSAANTTLKMHADVASSSPSISFPTIHTTTDSLPSTLDAIFLSPPWGGMDYTTHRHFTLDHIALENGPERTLLRSAVTACPAHIAYYLPRNTNGWSLGDDLQRCCHLAGSVELEQLYLHHKLKAVVLYIHTAAMAVQPDDDGKVAAARDIHEVEDTTEEKKAKKSSGCSIM